MRIAVVGAGQISRAYAELLGGRSDVTISTVVDRHTDRADELARSLPGAVVAELPQVLDDDAVDLVLNLTVPPSHAAITRAALQAGKHVYSEKPVGTTRSDVALGDAGGTPRLGCAPDTMLGTGIQTACAVVSDGDIGTPLAAHAVMVTPGHERWHPQPEFYYRPGGGPLLDMGPYYLSALVRMLGPVASVTGRGSRTRTERVIGRGPRAGSTFTTEVDTHQAGLLVHASGAVTTLVMSFEAVASTAPPIEVHGTDGSMTVPDPNHFDGEVTVRRRGTRQFEPVPERAGIRDAARGVGVLDLIASVRAGIEHQASAALAAHVLDVMLSLQESADDGGRPIPVTSSAPALPVLPLLPGPGL